MINPTCYFEIVFMIILSKSHISFVLVYDNFLIAKNLVAEGKCPIATVAFARNSEKIDINEYHGNNCNTYVRAFYH